MVPKVIHNLEGSLSEVKMLGVGWDVEDDLFRFEVPSSTVGAAVAT